MHYVFALPTPRGHQLGISSGSSTLGLGLILISLSLLLATPTPGSAQSTGGTITLPATTKVRLDLDVTKADGSVAGLTVGHLGGAHGTCGGTTRGFLSWTEPDGTVLWQRGQLPPKGTCSDPTALSLFEGFPVLDGGPVLSSDVHAAVVVPSSGRIAAAGEVRLAWQDPLTQGVLHTARGAFVGLWEPDGQLVRGHYVGRIPDGPGLPDGDCLMVCEDGGSDGWGDGEAWGARHLVVAGNEITVVGWNRPDPGDPANPPLPHLWVQRFSDDLAVPLWNTLDLAGTPMTARRAVVDSGGRTFVAGAGQDDATRSDRDVVLARLAVDGTVDLRQTFGGALDDEATDLATEADGSLRVEGFFTDEIEVAGVTLGGPGQGQQRFQAWLDTDLAWTGAGALAVPQGVARPRIGAANLGRLGRFPATSTRTPGAFDKVGDDHPAIPIAYQVMEGSEHRGQLAQIDSSDDDYMRIVASERDTVELRVLFDPDPHDRQALYLDRVRVELTTLFCYRAQILVKGMVSEDFQVAGERSLCPSEEPILEIDIPEDFSNQLGYDGSTYVDPNHRLVVAVRIAFGDPDADKDGFYKNTFYASAEEDTSVDHVEVIVEY